MVTKANHKINPIKQNNWHLKARIMQYRKIARDLTSMAPHLFLWEFCWYENINLINMNSPMEIEIIQMNELMDE